MFPAVYSTSIDVSWSCEEEEEREQEDKKELVYCVGLKKTTGDKEGWKEVYRGEDKKCSVSGLEKNTEYNVLVKCVVGEFRECGTMSQP